MRLRYFNKNHIIGLLSIISVFIVGLLMTCSNSKKEKMVTTNNVLSENCSIYFFKNVKTYVFSKLIYYVKLFNIESIRPRSSTKSQTKYFKKHTEITPNIFRISEK